MGISESRAEGARRGISELAATPPPICSGSVGRAPHHALGPGGSPREGARMHLPCHISCSHLRFPSLNPPCVQDSNDPGERRGMGNRPIQLILAIINIGIIL